MNRSCPKCHAANVRRSSTPAAEVTWRNHLFSRYRCRECLTQFWVISRRTYAATAAIVGAIALVVVVVVLMEMVFSRPSTPSRKRAEAAPLQRSIAAVASEATGSRTERSNVRPAGLPETLVARATARS